MMRNVVGLFAGAAALVVSTLSSAAPAKAACEFGPVSARTYGGPSVRVSSSTALYGYTYTLEGWNDTPWGGFRWLWSGARRVDTNCNGTNLHGATYTSELKYNGSNVQVTTPWTGLACNQTRWHAASHSGNQAINSTQVQIWKCY